jgi:hypothetical protein
MNSRNRHINKIDTLIPVVKRQFYLTKFLFEFVAWPYNLTLISDCAMKKKLIMLAHSLASQYCHKIGLFGVYSLIFYILWRTFPIPVFE